MLSWETYPFPVARGQPLTGQWTRVPRAGARAGVAVRRVRRDRDGLQWTDWFSGGNSGTGHVPDSFCRGGGIKAEFIALMIYRIG